MHSRLTHLLGRTTRIRRLLEREPQAPGTRASRRLRLQALLLRAQRRLADHLDSLGGRGPALVGG